MIIRQLKRDKALMRIKNLIVIWVSIVLIVLIILFYKNIKWFIYEWFTKKSEIMRWPVSIEGTISKKNDYPRYTHTIITKDKTIWIKSSTLNLNNYIWKLVSISGEYDTKNNNIINVDALKLEKEKIIVRWNQYTFLSTLVSFDFLDQQEVKAIQNDDTSISINVYNDKTTTFQRFSCRKILKWQPCDAIIQDYESKWKEVFESIQWYKFYKHADKYRLTFDNNYWYIFKDITDENMLNLSNSFKIINEKFIIDNKLEEIQNNCKNDTDSSTEIVKSDLQYGSENNIIQIILDTKTEKWKNAKCSLTFDIWNWWKITEKSFIIE